MKQNNCKTPKTKTLETKQIQVLLSPSKFPLTETAQLKNELPEPNL